MSCWFSPWSQRAAPWCNTALTAILDARILTVLQKLAVQETCGGSRKMQYGGIFGTMLIVVKSQLVGTVLHFLEYWEPEELCIPPFSGGMEQWKRCANRGQRGNYRYPIAFIRKIVLAIWKRWWRHYTRAKLEISSSVLLMISILTHTLQRLYLWVKCYYWLPWIIGLSLWNICKGMIW